MQAERNHIENLILDQNSHLMKNGMNAIIDLNSKLSRRVDRPASRDHRTPSKHNVYKEDIGRAGYQDHYGLNSGSKQRRYSK